MRVPGFLAFLLVHGFAAAAASVPLPFDLTPQGAIVVPAIVNGTGPAAFMLDTGSNGSVVSGTLASALGARVVAKTTLMSASGQKDALVVKIEHLNVGGVVATGVLMTLASPDDFNLPDLAASGHHVQGVIGQDVLGALRYTIDYRKRRIVWHDAPHVPQHATVFELESQNDRFVALLPQSDRVLRLVPDTGAETLILFQSGNGTVPSATLAHESAELTGLTGTRAAQRAIVRALRVGATTLMDVAAVIVGGECDSPSLDGLLPLHIFARVTFNGPERQLFIEDR